MISKTYKSLKKTRDSLFNAVSLITGKKKLDNFTIDKFEEKLLLCDIGFDVTEEIISKLKKSIDSKIEIETLIKNTISDFLIDISFGEEDRSGIIMVSGINGTGKTTSCAKLAHYYKNINKKVLVIAADTFRAAAKEQILFWCSENNIECFDMPNSKDPSSIIFEGLKYCKTSNYDKIIIDTAGRLHTSANLMNELNKMERVIEKFEDSYDSWISIDSTSGKNAINQISVFQKHLKISGIILNKMDGSAKGGAAIPIMKEYNIPVKFIGTGEKIDDIETFNLDSYLEGFFDEKN